MKVLYGKISRLLKNRKTRKIFTSILSFLSAGIVFFTTYAMVLPAITMEKTASCGIEEHQHDDSCYEYVLTCGQEESEGHHHDDSCYTVTKELDCELEEHRHSQENGCYDEEGNLICELPEHVHDDSCYKEVKTLTCGQEESEGHHHTDACYEKVLVCDKEVHTHSANCYKNNEAADDAKKGSEKQIQQETLPEDSQTAASESAAAESSSENFIPDLSPVNMEAVFGENTGFYYFHAQDGQEIPSNSAEITDWQKVKDDTKLASTDLVKMYLPYTIPAGSLNETNPTARYRLPGNIHLTDEQIEAINKYENGIAAGYAHSDENYKKYLGAEAIEGDRKPDELLQDGAEEYISATVKAENVYKDDKYLGQDLIFTFVPYTIEKNQKTYDAEKNLVSAGKKVTGWFACDFKMDQIDWIEEGAQAEVEEEKTADILFVSENKDEDIQEIKRSLTLVEKKEEAVSDENSAETFKAGTLTAEGDGYKITLDYTEEAKIPENASLSVREITAETDKEAYEACLAQAQQHVDESAETKSTVDSKASRFFDIEIQTADENGNVQKTEPAAPVSVNIQITDAPLDSADNASESDEAQKSDPTVLHFAEDGVEKVESTTAPVKADNDHKDADASSNSVDGAEISFEAESFSIYGLVYTVDFHWEVDGKTYNFSIPGGGFVSLTDLVEVLGIIGNTNNEEDGTEAGTDEAKKFVGDVEKVEFSSPELVDVSKVKNDTTVGQIKENRGLACEYSADLTEEQIAEINAQTVEAGDWALISVHPFISKESLTVTMKNGDSFTIQVTDGQIHTYAISDSGDTYKITVTYDDTTGIPADAELRVRQLTPDDDRYQEDIERSNSALLARYDQGATNPVVFDIKIIANDEEIEPIEGTQVSVEITLAMDAMNEETQGEDGEAAEGVESADEAESEEEGYLLIDGVEYTLEQTEVPTTARVVHLTDDGEAVVVEDMQSMVDVDNNLVLSFNTESFSDYTIQPGDWGRVDLNSLPSVIYVGDEIYMQNLADYWVTGIGSVVTETKYNNLDSYKSVRATSPGTFRICHKNDWNNGDTGYTNQYAGKYITILPARSEGNNGQPYPGTTPPATIETIDNASIGLKLNLFDYDLDDYLDNRFNNQDYGSSALGAFTGHGINSDHSLKFWGSGITSYDYGYYNRYVEHGVTSIVNNTTDTGKAGGYPVLKDGDKKSLDYLFTPSDGTDKKAYTNVNGLFKKDGDYYVYDSDQNYAWYNPATNSFEVYNGTYKQKLRKDGGEQASQVSTKNIGFFPFHEWDDQYDLFVNWNKNLNHHFGMSMSVDFSLPKDPKAVKDSTGNPIIFEFSGDDDLWVFIDGKLAMDIGGIHLPTSGTINFTDKKVTVNNNAQSFDFSKLYDGKKHTMQVFYIERGGCDSNCKIKFNMTQYGNVEFDKVDEDDQSKLLSGAVFGLYKDDKCTQPLMEELNDGSRRTFIVETDENGHAKLEDVPLGDYYLKEIHAPDGYPIAVGSDTVRVRVYLDASGNVKTSVGGQETDAKITNKKPANINLGLKKEWQDADGQTIAAPEGVNATFEIKRNRTYETYTERPVQGHGEEASHLVVGWLHNNEPHIYEEYDLVAGSQATVSWSLVDEYEGKIGCILDGQEQTKSSNPNNIYSHGFTMPAAGETTILYIIDESDHGNAIKNINVAGSQFYGNSGGGFIHEFKTVTEPDPDFTYTGTSVTDNKVILPVNESTWEYMFGNLPAIGTGTVTVGEKQQKVTYKYSYYIEEVSSTAPEGTVVIYKDLKGNVINSPTDAETHTSGTETVINKVPYGYLQIKKEVTYNGSSENLTTDQKSKLAGEYKFKIYKKEQCAAEDAVQDPNAAADAADKDLIVTITIDTDGKAVVGPNTPVKLLVGNYWIKEVESSNPAMFPVNNPIAVAVTKDHTSDSPVIKSLTNNYDENNGPDKISIDIEKKFSGLDNAAQVPRNFEVLLQYTLSGQTKTVTLKNTELATGENGEKITWSQSTDGFTWHWKVTNIPSEAKNFKIKEQNYDNAKGYDWKSATLNGSNITSTVDELHDLTVTAPAAELTDVTNDRRTSDSGQNTVFYLEDDDILLSKLTANQGTLVISKHPLNLAERDAVEKGWPQTGGFKTPPHFFSIDEHPNGFSYGDKRITFGEKNGRTIVKFTQNASAQEAVFAVNYSSEEARNNANLANTYEEVPVTIDIIKVDENDNTKKLPGAVFTLRQIADKAPTADGTLETLDGTTPTDSDPTDTNGKTSFSNLTHGYYEISEKTSPAGYVISGDVTFYFKIESGEVKWLVKGTNKPSEWEEKSVDEMVGFEPAHPAVEADPENNIEAQSASNATFTVKNEPGAALPSTGGSGTRLYTILGMMLITFGATMLLFRRQTH